jgi:hypothetical protein
MDRRVNLLRQARRGLLLLALLGTLMPTAAFAGGWGNQRGYAQHRSYSYNNSNAIPSDWEGHHSTWDDSDERSSYRKHFRPMVGRGYWGAPYGKGYGHGSNQARVYWSGNGDDDDDTCDCSFGRFGYGRGGPWYGSGCGSNHDD